MGPVYNHILQSMDFTPFGGVEKLVIHDHPVIYLRRSGLTMQGEHQWNFFILEPCDVAVPDRWA